jgi:hypothetical protein
MEPIIPLLTSSQDMTPARAPENPAASEGDFQSVLKAFQSSTEESEVEQDSSVADPTIVSVLLSMLPVPLDPNPIVSSEVLGGESGKNTVPTLGLPNPIDPWIQGYGPQLTQVNEKDLQFPGEIVIRDEKGWSPVVNTQPVVNPQDQGTGTIVVPGTPSVLESPLETLPPAQDLSSPSPVSSSNQTKNVLTAGTQPQESSNPSALSPMDTAHVESGMSSSRLIDPANIPLLKNGTDPAGQEKLKEVLNALFRLNKGSVNSNVKNVNGLDERTEQGAKRGPAFQPGTMTLKSPQENSPTGEAVARSPKGEEAISPLFEELTGSKKTAAEAVEQDGNLPFTKKGLENVGESSLILKPEGNQAASSPNEVTKTRETALPRTEAPEILQQISNKLIWSVRSGEDKIKLQLEPPQLGSLYIEINRQKDILQATVWTNNQVTKELLESHQVELQRILKEDGFHLGQFDVFVNPHTKSFQERMQGQTDYDRRDHGSHEPRGSLSPGESEVAPLPITSRMKGSSYIDLFI